MSELKDKIAKSYRWRDFDHFERNADYIDGDFIKAVNDVCELTAEITDLKQRNEALEDVDDIAGSYRDLAAKAIEALSGYSFRDDFQKEFDELQKEFEEIKNA